MFYGTKENRENPEKLVDFINISIDSIIFFESSKGIISLNKKLNFNMLIRWNKFKIIFDEK